MAENDRRETELVLAPNEFAFVLDTTKGQVNVCVGPYKGTVSTTERPVTYDGQSRRYRPCQLEQATQQFVYVPEGHYVELQNPSADNNMNPPAGTPTQAVKLQVGRKVNIPGPCTFPLWPGQVARVLEGHHLRSNQYVVARVYNEDAARTNWAQAVVKPQTPTGSGDGSEETTSSTSGVAIEPPDLTMGKLMVIEGTKVSFYIPPTGIEVVQEEPGQYTRDAITLEQLEYCILLNEDGRKRYVQGPAVVFPKPTEQFVEHTDKRKFRAYELSDTTGINLKVIAPYTDEDGEHASGEELFLFGDGKIYFPRPEHAIITYHGQSDPRIFAIAIPEGNGRYVLNRHTGEVTIVMGPKMYLPDPRNEVIVKRVLSDKQVGLWYPGSNQALAYNQALRAEADQRLESLGLGQDDEALVRTLGGGRSARTSARFRGEATEGFISDQFNRQTAFTPPRTITIDDRYEGAVKVSIWTGYVVQIVRSTGDRRVVVGPQDVLLDYNESLEVLELSTGKPKTTDKLLRTVYLRASNNTVSDVIRAETRDLCPVEIKLSYRVNFEGDSTIWFAVENYVKFLCDHLKSLIKNAVKHETIENFYQNAVDVIRDLVLGKSEEGNKRPGRLFNENGMRVYDLEVMFVEIKDESVRSRLEKDQFDAISQTLEVAGLERRLNLTQRRESITRDIVAAEATTVRVKLEIEEQNAAAQHSLAVSQERFRALEEDLHLQTDESKQPRLDAIAEATRLRALASEEQRLAISQKMLDQTLTRLDAETKAATQKAGAISPNLIAALQAFSERDLLRSVATAIGPMSLLGGTSVSDVLSKIFADTPLAKLVKNGNSSSNEAVAPHQ